MSSTRDDMLFELEQRLAQTGRKLTAEEASSLITEDFVEFGASGEVWSKAEMIAAMSQWSPTERIVESFSVREQSASVCLVTKSLSFFAQKFYMAQYRRKIANSLPPGNQRAMRVRFG
jgi:hypothetical protein